MDAILRSNFGIVHPVFDVEVSSDTARIRWNTVVVGIGPGGSRASLSGPDNSPLRTSL